MANPQNDQNSLLESLKLDDNEAFVNIYNQYWESLYAIGYNRLKSQSDVEDIIQELFTDLWNNRKSIKIKGSLKIYLFTALKYKVIDHLRRKKMDYVSIDKVHATFSSSNESPEKILSLSELYDQLRDGIEQLPDQCKLVFKMSRDLEMSAAEIAHDLKVSRRTVETQIYKSLKSLKRSLSDYPLLFIILSSNLNF